MTRFSTKGQQAPTNQKTIERRARELEEMERRADLLERRLKTQTVYDYTTVQKPRKPYVRKARKALSTGKITLLEPRMVEFS
jgi:hypothetical protein